MKILDYWRIKEALNTKRWSSEVKYKINSKKGVVIYDEELQGSLESGVEEKTLSKILTHDREQIIIGNNIKIYDQLVGHRFFVYNGCRLKSLSIKPQMVGYKVGEFVETLTRSRKRKHMGRKARMKMQLEIQNFVQDLEPTEVFTKRENKKRNGKFNKSGRKYIPNKR